jgi:hypothetical protein
MHAKRGNPAHCLRVFAQEGNAPSFALPRTGQVKHTSCFWIFLIERGAKN